MTNYYCYICIKNKNKIIYDIIKIQAYDIREIPQRLMTIFGELSHNCVVISIMQNY